MKGKKENSNKKVCDSFISPLMVIRGTFFKSLQGYFGDRVSPGLFFIRLLL